MTVRIISALLVSVLTAETLCYSVENPSEKTRRDVPPTTEASVSRRELEPRLTRSEIRDKYLTPDPCNGLNSTSLASAWTEGHQKCNVVLLKYNKLYPKQKRCPYAREPGCRVLNPLEDPIPRCTVTYRLPDTNDRASINMEWCLAKGKSRSKPKASPNAQPQGSSSGHQPQRSLGVQGKPSFKATPVR